MKKEKLPKLNFEPERCVHYKVLNNYFMFFLSKTRFKFNNEEVNVGNCKMIILNSKTTKQKTKKAAPKAKKAK